MRLFLDYHRKDINVFVSRVQDKRLELHPSVVTALCEILAEAVTLGILSDVVLVAVVDLSMFFLVRAISLS